MTDRFAHLENLLEADVQQRLLSDATRGQLNTAGYFHAEGLIQPRVCQALIDALAGAEFIEVRRNDRRGDTHFFTVNGTDLEARLPGMDGLYRYLGDVAAHLAERPLCGLDDLSIGLSLNCTPPGGAFVRHFDRNDVSASVMLNTVAGGALELWPNIYSSSVGALGRLANRTVMQLSLLKRPVRIPAAPGDVVFFSRRTLHGVAAIEGMRSRVSLIMAYDQPGVTYSQDQDYYGRADTRITLETLNA